MRSGLCIFERFLLVEMTFFYFKSEIELPKSEINLLPYRTPIRHTNRLGWFKLLQVSLKGSYL